MAKQFNVDSSSDTGDLNQFWLQKPAEAATVNGGDQEISGPYLYVAGNHDEQQYVTRP